MFKKLHKKTFWLIIYLRRVVGKASCSKPKEQQQEQEIKEEESLSCRGIGALWEGGHFERREGHFERRELHFEGLGHFGREGTLREGRGTLREGSCTLRDWGTWGGRALWEKGGALWEKGAIWESFENTLKVSFCCLFKLQHSECGFRKEYGFFPKIMVPQNGWF